MTLDDILLLSQHMLALSERGQWQALAESEREFARQLSALDQAVLQDRAILPMLERIKTINDQIIVNGRRGTTELIASMRQLRVGKKAHSAYQGQKG